MKEINSKLIYIDSLSRIFGSTFDFQVEIPPIFTRQENKNNLITVSLVDCSIRSTWYNVRETNNKFWLVNYDTTLGNYTTTTAGIKNPLAEWKTVPSTNPVLAWSPDSPNHHLIEIEVGNYDIYGLAQAIQNALNDGYDGVNTKNGTNSRPNCTNTSVTMLADDGQEYTWLGQLWSPDGGVAGEGQGLLWTVTWIKETGKMKFEYENGVSTTNLAFDFRTSGNFMFCDFYDKASHTGVEMDIQNGAFELMGFDRHGFQSNLFMGTDDEEDRRGKAPQAEWLGGKDTFTQAMADAGEVTGVTNSTNPIGGDFPYPALSDHPCLVGAPKSIFINTNLPLANIASYRKVATIGGIATATDTEFSNSSIFAKIMNNQQWYSTITFQSQGDDDYALKTDDLQYINQARFWLCDEWGFLLRTAHDWSMTLKWTESVDEDKARNTALESMNDLLQMILLQRETEDVRLEVSKKINPNEILLAPREVAEKKAQEVVKQEEALRTEKPEAYEQIRKRVLDEEIERDYAKMQVFGDAGGGGDPYTDEQRISAGMVGPTQNWVREHRPGYKGDGGDLFPREWKHLRHFKGLRPTKLRYSYAGPGTEYKKRMARGDVGINPIDYAAREHDRVYADPLATIDEIQKADLILEKTANAVAKKYPELWTDAKIVANMFKAKRGLVGWGLAKANMFASGGKF